MVRSLGLKLSDTRAYEPQIRARLGTTAHFCKEVVLKLRAVGDACGMRGAVCGAIPGCKGGVFDHDCRALRLGGEACSEVGSYLRLID